MAKAQKIKLEEDEVVTTVQMGDKMKIYNIADRWSGTCLLREILSERLISLVDSPMEMLNR